LPIFKKLLPRFFPLLSLAFLGQLLDVLICLPYALRTEFFLFLEFLFADIGHINFDAFDVTGISLEGTEEEH
jgi:hypothetical protein